MNDIKQIILPESPEAASVQTVTGWVSSNGRYWGDDEQMARYDGSTHRKCACGEVIEQRSYCETCHAKRELDKFLAMKKKPWDGVAMLYSLLNDEYYSTPDYAVDYADENDLKLEDLQLIICEPNYAQEIDYSYWSDQLPDDYDGNDVLEAAIKALNKTIKDEILSWSAGDFALDLTDLHNRWNERNMVVDSEGWIQWNGGEMPVEKGTRIDVKYRNGEINLHVSAGTPLVDNGSMPGKYACAWYSSESKYSIVAYRLHVPQEQKTPQQLALEKFGTDWHENEGVQPVGDKVLIDLIMCNGDEKKKYLANHWSWHKEQALKIKKWRIHSDQAALLREPMPSCSQEIPCYFVDKKSPLETQIGGDHYTKLAIQPMQYSMKNGLDPLQHTIIKYVTRFRDKAGIEDLEKAKHCIDMLIEFEKESK